MQRMIVESNFEGMIHFSRLIETMQKSIRLVKGFFPGFTFIILKIEGVRLRVEENSSIEVLKGELEERTYLLADGSLEALKEYLRRDGVLD